MPLRVNADEITDEVMANFNRTDHINLVARKGLEERLLDPVENQFRPLDVRALELPELQQLMVGVDSLDVGEEIIEAQAGHPVVVLGTHVEGDARDVDQGVIFIGYFL